jgi:hypothetical protein
MNMDTPCTTDNGKHWGRVSLIYLALLAYFWSFSKYGLNIWDEGGFANGTLRTLNGEKALGDFNPNGYLPGRYWYGMIFFKLFGVEIQSLRISVLLITPPMVIMIYSIGKKIMPAGFALLAALFMLSAPSMYYNRFYTFFVILNLYCLINVLEKRNLASLAGLGTAIFLSAFFKFEVTLFSLLISLTLFALLFFTKHGQFDFSFSPVKAASSAGSSSKIYYLGVSVILLMMYLGQDGYFLKVFKMVVDAHEVWGNPFPEIFPFFALLEEIGAHQMFERALFYLPIFTYVVVASLLLTSLITKKQSFPINYFMVIAILLFGVCAFGLVIWRAGFDNLLRTLPPFYLLVCYLLYRIREKMMSRLKPLGGKEIGLLTRLPLNLLTVFLPFVFYFEMNTQHGFYAGSIGALKLETTHLSLEKVDVYTNPSEAKWIKTVVEKIKLHSQKGDAILALPLNPIFYFLSDRVNPTPYEWILPGMLDENEELKLVALLETKLPKLVIYVDIAIDGKEERRLSRYAPHLYKFLVKHYSFQEMVGIFQILLPKKNPTPLNF